MPRHLTTRLQRAAIESGQFIARVEVRDSRNDELLITSDPVNIHEPRMKVIGGSITTDDTRSIAGTGTAQLLVDQETASALFPIVTDAGLSPTAPARIWVRFLAPGDHSVIDYGTYEVDTLTINHSSQGVTVNVEVADNSRRVDRAVFVHPYKIPFKTPFADAFHILLDRMLPDSDIDVGRTSMRTPLLTFDEQANRLEAVRGLAEAAGFRIDWNANGHGDVDIIPAYDVHEEPIWDLTDDNKRRSGRAITIERLLTDERTYNGVIVLGESPGTNKPPVRAEAWDQNNASPTYYNPGNPDSSQYGPVPFFFPSPFIWTKSAAVAAAKAQLPKVLGLVDVLRITAVPNPGIIPGDTIYVRDSRVGVRGIYVVESTEMPLTAAAGPMTITCRDRRIID